MAVDSGSGQATDLSRIDPRPSELAMLDNKRERMPHRKHGNTPL